MKIWLDNKFEMPDKLVALLIRILEQNKGKFSSRATKNEFKDLTEKEIEQIEIQYQACFERE